MARKKNAEQESHITVDSLPSESRFEFGILSKVVLSFIILSLLPLGGLALISLESMDSISDTSIERSSVALEEEANSTLIQFAADKSTQIDLDFQHYENLLNVTANYAEKIWAVPENYTARTAYYHDPSISQEPPGFQYSEVYGYNVSFDVSCYKLAPRAFGDKENDYLDANFTETPQFRENVNASVNTSIENTGKLEDLLVLQYQQNPDISLIYAGTKDGVHRPYPWHTYSKSYDPIERGWFKRANATRDMVVWSEPYIDASGQGLVLTASRSIRDRSLEGEPLVGAVGFDIRINTLKEDVRALSVYNTGYSFLVNSEGKTVGHKNLSSEDAISDDITVYEGTTFAPVMNNMTQGKTGLDSFTRENKTYFVAYHPVASTGFSFAVVADSDEVLKSVRETENEISSKRDETLEYMMSLVAVAVLAVTLIGIMLARKIVNPLRKLTQTALEVSEGELDQTIHVLSKDEIGKLAKAFEKMVAALRKANIMIAREEHKGEDSTGTLSQEQVRLKARSVLGIKSTPAPAKTSSPDPATFEQKNGSFAPTEEEMETLKTPAQIVSEIEQAGGPAPLFTPVSGPDPAFGSGMPQPPERTDDDAAVIEEEDDDDDKEDEDDDQSIFKLGSDMMSSRKGEDEGDEA